MLKFSFYNLKATAAIYFGYTEL